MSDPRLKTFCTTDGKRTLSIRYVNGEPRAWITDHGPDFQAQHQFAVGIERELCEMVFGKEE